MQAGLTSSPGRVGQGVEVHGRTRASSAAVQQCAALQVDTAHTTFSSSPGRVGQGVVVHGGHRLQAEGQHRLRGAHSAGLGLLGGK